MRLIWLNPQWMLKLDQGSPQALDEVIALLMAVDEEKNLTRACSKVQLSYRHAWGLIQRAGQQFGAPLLNSIRGQGATLSTLGERIVWANRRVTARLAPVLENSASELEAEIRQVAASHNPSVRIRASHSFAMDALREHLRTIGHPFEQRSCGGIEALAALSHSTCDIAGFHVPIGDLESQVLDRWRKWLKPRAYVLINFVSRRQGLIVAAGNPKHIVSLADIAERGVRFVNRQPGSGTRLLLDLLLRREGIDCREISGFDNVEFTHSAVAAYIASGMGDAGMGVETAARLFRLNFIPLLEERYFLVCREDALDSRLVAPILGILRSREFRARLSALPGIDALACGTTVSLLDTFPHLAGRRSVATARMAGKTA
jgi:molybdate transport repressor ModE-like protein